MGAMVGMAVADSVGAFLEFVPIGTKAGSGDLVVETHSLQDILACVCAIYSETAVVQCMFGPEQFGVVWH